MSRIKRGQVTVLFHLTLLALMTLGLAACGGSSQTAPWTKEVGVTGAGIVGSALTVDSSGNIYVGGITQAGLDGNTLTGAADMFVTEYNASGGRLKTDESGVAGDQIILGGVAVDSGGNIVSAGYTYTSYDASGYPTGCIGRLAKSGSAGYSVQIGAATYDTVVNGVAVDAGGNAYVAGSTTGDLVAPPTGSKDLFLAKYDSGGNAVFTVQYGVSGYATIARSVAIDGSGNVLVAYDSGNYDPSGPTGESHTYVAKYSSSGTLLATYQADSSSGLTQAAALAVDGSGNILVAYTGQDLGTYGSYLTKLSPSGTAIFAPFLLPSQFGSYVYNNIVSSLAVDVSGNVLVAGSLMINGGYSGGYVAKYDGAGNKVYLNQISPDASGYTLNAAAVAVDASGNTYVAGSMTGSLDGNPWSGSTSYFLVKYDAMGIKQ